MEIVFKLKIKEEEIFLYFPVGNVAGSLNTFGNKRRTSLETTKTKQNSAICIFGGAGSVGYEQTTTNCCTVQDFGGPPFTEYIFSPFSVYFIQLCFLPFTKYFPA